MKVVLTYPPFCPPTVPPYSITYLKACLAASGLDVKCIDLNAKFYRGALPDLYGRLGSAKASLKSYSGLLERYASRARRIHREESLAIVRGGAPEHLKYFIDLVLAERPDLVGFSLVYNSQLQYGKRLAEELEAAGVPCVAGGPAAKSLRTGIKVLRDEAALLEHLGCKRMCGHPPLDFGDYYPADYLTKDMVYPLRTSRGCPHRRCAFCTHHAEADYVEFDLGSLRESIVANGMRNIFFVDDTITPPRLDMLADALRPLGVRWWCQTRPTAELLGSFVRLRSAGLASISFGVESGNQRMLDRMGKGIDVGVVEDVLAESHRAGVRNMVFVMFGFPGETEESFMDTVSFLERNGENIDMVSSSVFGLQRGSRVHENPEDYGVSCVSAVETPLGERMKYRVDSGIGEDAAKELKEAANARLRRLNKMPKVFGLLKEQALLF